MVLTQRLQMRQGQSLVMSPRLQQAIKLLQMSSFELQAFVDTEVEGNPLLDGVEGRSVDAGDSEFVAEPVASPSGDNDDAAGPLGDSGGTGIHEAFDSHSGSDGTRKTTGAAPSDALEFQSTLSREPTLTEHLTEQLHLAIAEPAEKMIGLHLIGMVNEAGYLTGDLHSVAEALGTSLGQVERTLAVLQTFEPSGVFARDLAECLALQLKERDRLDPAMATLLAHLDLVAKRDLEELREHCGVDLGDIRDMIAEIRRLNPKPGNAFGHAVIQPLIPDIFIRPCRDGSWLVELNTHTLPHLLINSQYRAVVSRGPDRESDRLYVSECHAKAAWLIKTLNQRARTILAVSREIVRRQEAFLMHGVEALKPLKLRDVADALGMHESTVSRVAANKYMQTPRGTFEMKYFFAGGLAARDGGESHSTAAVRLRIKELIAAESPENVLTDEMIADRLRSAGINVARRTVAKYRESLNLPSSTERRRERTMQGTLRSSAWLAQSTVH